MEASKLRAQLAHFTGSATTVAQMEAAIAAEATQIAVKTPGTAGHVLLHSVDAFSAQ